MTTPLDTFLTASKISDAEFGVMIDKDRTTVNRIRNGKVRPTLEVAALIETHTGGAVKMQVWAGLSVASCGTCDRRTDDPACASCVRSDCGIRHKEAA